MRFYNIWSISQLILLVLAPSWSCHFPAIYHPMMVMLGRHEGKAFMARFPRGDCHANAVLHLVICHVSMGMMTISVVTSDADLWGFYATRYQGKFTDDGTVGAPQALSKWPRSCMIGISFVPHRFNSTSLSSEVAQKAQRMSAHCVALFSVAWQAPPSVVSRG